ncbi:MAG: DUF1573 domain-containing protein [Desulfuromonadales bacterium]|nr:DUF1573 domain-containing protein [Desulfuromonadales bacterium]
MRHVCLWLLLLFPVSPAFAAPALVVERLQSDFGEITQGHKITETFRFHNAGDQMLQINHLRSSCGCTAALLTTRRLEPGAIGELQLTFNSDGFRGKVQKIVSFETNDPDHRLVAFALQGIVTPELIIEPGRINWGVVTKETLLQTELEIVNRSAGTITLQQPEVTSAGIVAKLSSLRIVAGEKVTLAVAAAFPADKKRLAGYVLIKTDLVNLPQLKVSVSARLASE